MGGAAAGGPAFGAKELEVEGFRKTKLKLTGFCSPARPKGLLAQRSFAILSTVSPPLAHE